MRVSLCMLSLAAALMLPLSIQAQVEMTSRADSISYALGMDVAQRIAQLGVEVNADMLSQGLSDVFNETESQLDEESFKQMMTAFQQEAQAAQQRVAQERAQKAEAEGQAFLAENAGKDGVQQTESGLQYKILTPGSGDYPTRESKVRVHYEGRLINGKVFDSSYKRGAPTEFGVGQVISGWTEALQLMQPGAKWELYIPSNLAYGSRGAGQDIGPNETLIFTVELLDIL